MKKNCSRGGSQLWEDFKVISLHFQILLKDDKRETWIKIRQMKQKGED